MIAGNAEASKRETRQAIVTIVIANHNKDRYLAATLESVFATDYGALEVIVVDDASTDGSGEILARYGLQEGRMTLKLLPSRVGGAAARNVGLSLAHGDFVLFLDSDDLIAPDAVRRRVAIAAGNQDFDAWLFPMVCFSGDVSNESGRWMPELKDALRRFVSHEIPWSIMQPLWSAAAIKRLGGFDERFERLQDVELHTRALIEGLRFMLHPPGYGADCYYRTDDERTAVANVVSHKRDEAALRYYVKFCKVLPASLHRYLRLTLLESIYRLSILRHSGLLDRLTAAHRAEHLWRSVCDRRARTALRAYAAIAIALPFRVPGVRRLARIVLPLI